MATNYSGTLTVSGSLADSLGEHGSFSGTLGVSLTANLNGSGSGTASETVTGTVFFQYVDVYGQSGSGTIPFNFSTPQFPFQFGSFHVSQQVPVALLGAQFGIVLDGAVNIDQSAISESMFATISGVYSGVAFNGQFSGSAALSAPPVPHTIESFGVTALIALSGQFYLRDTSGPTVKYQGSSVRAGQLGAWTPIAAEAKSGGGFQVAWTMPGTGQFTVWNTDSNGNFVSSALGVVSGSDPELEGLETSFQQDINGDGQIGVVVTTIEAVGTTRLVQAGNQYFLRDSGGNGPLIKYQGSAIVAGQLGAWTPVAAEAKSGGGFQVAWKMPGAGQFTVWNTDSNGNYVSSAVGVVSASDPTLEGLETSFQQDINGDGQIGVVVTTIEAAGATRLVQAGNQYFLRDSGGNGPSIKYQGSAIVAGQLGTWVPIGTEHAASGYQVAWSMPGTGVFTVWNTDSNGNYVSSAVGVVSASDATLESLETGFQQDLNGDGHVGTVTASIEAFGATRLVKAANQYALRDNGGSGPSIKYQGAAVTVGQLGTWIPIGAEQSGGGFKVAWSLPGTGIFTVWNTDSNGNYVSSAVGLVTGADATFQGLETSFQQDLNGDGHIGVLGATIETSGATRLVQSGNQYFMRDGGGAGPSIKYLGSAVTAGQLGTWVPIGAEQTAGGFQVAWKMVGSDAYTVWNTDSSGNYTSSVIGVVTGADFTLQKLETSFAQDLNTDGRLAAAVNTGTLLGEPLDLTGDSTTRTINLNGNTASVSPGLSAPSLTFIGPPDAITLGPAAATVQFTPVPSSGVETIANFDLGQDMLNLDLLGAASASLVAFDTTVGGVHAIALTGITDLSHGVVLLGMPAGQTAAGLLADHTLFVGGHALIS